MTSEIGKWALALAIGVALIVLGWKVPYVMITLHVLLCLLLIVVVLLQSGKAADLAGAFGGAGSQTAFGPRGAATFLSKATTWCAIMFMLTSISISLQKRPEAGAGGSLLERTQQPQPAPAKTPASPSPLQPSAPQQQAPAQPPKK
jgi:preprotein translocase subunit SecG